MSHDGGWWSTAAIVRLNGISRNVLKVSVFPRSKVYIELSCNFLGKFCVVRMKKVVYLFFSSTNNIVNIWLIVKVRNSINFPTQLKSMKWVFITHQHAIHWVVCSELKISIKFFSKQAEREIYVGKNEIINLSSIRELSDSHFSAYSRVNSLNFEQKPRCVCDLEWKYFKNFRSIDFQSEEYLVGMWIHSCENSTTYFQFQCSCAHSTHLAAK